MNAEERDLFWKLCCFDNHDTIKLTELLPNYSTPAVLGQLFFNRMQGIAYGVLKETNMLGKVNREFRNALQGAYWQNIEKNNSYFECLKRLNTILKDCKGRYAMLKGAVLCNAYPSGYRTANDIDLLVRPSDITTIGDILTAADFRQGHIRNGIFIPATRQEIIESKMMRGETVPYIKEVNLPYLHFLEVDINFSLDYKNTVSHAVNSMIQNSGEVVMNDVRIITLDKYDFFIHLCGHLYKEMTTWPWIEMKRDMTLYKFCDIYMLLSELSATDICVLFDRAKELDMAHTCCLAILWTASLFSVTNDVAVNRAKQELIGKEHLLNSVVFPKEGKTYMYTEKDLKNRFFSENRISLLKEI